MDALIAILGDSPAAAVVSLHDGSLLYGNTRWFDLVPDAKDRHWVENGSLMPVGGKRPVFDGKNPVGLWYEESFYENGAWLIWSPLTVENYPPCVFGSILPGQLYDPAAAANDHKLMWSNAKTALQIDELVSEFQLGLQVMHRSAERLKTLRAEFIENARWGLGTRFEEVVDLVDLRDRNVSDVDIHERDSKSVK